MDETRTFHLSMTGAQGELVYHLEGTRAQLMEIAQAHRGPEALAVTDSARCCHAHRAYGSREAVAAHPAPHPYDEERG